MFCDFHVSLKQPLCQGDINSTNLPCSTSVHPILGILVFFFFFFFWLFFLLRGERIQITLKPGHHWPPVKRHSAAWYMYLRDFSGDLEEFR